MNMTSCNNAINRDEIVHKRKRHQETTMMAQIRDITRVIYRKEKIRNHILRDK